MAKGDKMAAVLDLRGLDLVTPVDLLNNGHTPFSKNFRLYAQQTDDRRVAVSSRKGPGYHTTPIGETLSASNTASTGASTAKVGINTTIHLQPLTAPNNDRITRIDISVANPDNAYGPLLVKIYDDLDGKPDTLLSESSIASGDIGETAAYETARFLNAPKLVSGNTYWIVVQVQDDGGGEYVLSTTTAGTKAYSTDSALFSAVEKTYALNFKVYTAPNQTNKGAYRFARDNGNNITLAAYDTTMYTVNEVDGTHTAILTGMNAAATDYAFTNGDNKAFWVNGYDNLTAWDGTSETTNNSLISNGTFEVNATGWAATGGGTGAAVARSTAQFNSGVASLSVTATSGLRVARQTLVLEKGKRYKFTAWVKGASAASNAYFYLNGPNLTVPGTTVTLTTSWQKIEAYYAPTVTTTASIDIRSDANNFFLDDVAITYTGIEYIIDAELPILSDVEMHKDRLWGRSAADPNKLVFSENPGNPAFDSTGLIPKTAREQWYYEWLSVSFIYVPRPHNGSPITGMVSFQDSLQVLTQDRKYVISGYDRGSFVMREATGNRGALSSRGIASDENRIYFVSGDGLYEYNGSADKKISTLINPLFDGCQYKEKISTVIWNNEVRFYFAAEGSPYNNSCIIYNKDLQEIQYDTDTWVDRAVYYGDADDEQQLVEFSSLVPASYLAEQDYNSLGAPIDFEYRLKYDSMGTPAQKKRIKKFFPLIQGVDSSFPLTIGVDKDFQDSPRLRKIQLTINGNILGQFNLDEGVTLDGDTSFKMHRQSLSGYGYYWQARIMRKAVNNRVAFIGAQFSYKTKRI